MEITVLHRVANKLNLRPSNLYFNRGIDTLKITALSNHKPGIFNNYIRMYGLSLELWLLVITLLKLHLLPNKKVRQVGQIQQLARVWEYLPVLL
jgi:hypothetical protein